MKDPDTVTEQEIDTRIAQIEAKAVARRAEASRRAYKIDVTMVVITLVMAIVLFASSTIRGDVAKEVYDNVYNSWPLIVAIYTGLSIRRIVDYRQ